MNSKFIIFVDHLAEFNNEDCYVSLDGNDVLQAMASFNKKFDVYNLHNKVYLYKMMKRVHHNTYTDILINRGNGWNIEENPIEMDVYNINDEY